MSANIESRDAARLTAGFSEDVVITLPGKDPIVGREAAKQWYQELFDKIADEKVTVKGWVTGFPSWRSVRVRRW